jgi:hypothetical protein
MILGAFKQIYIKRALFAAVCFSVLGVSPGAVAHQSTSITGSNTGSITGSTKTLSDYMAEGWIYYTYGPYTKALAQIKNVNADSSDDQSKCDQFYSKIHSTREMKILIGLGYYDSSEGETTPLDYYPEGSRVIAHGVFGVNATQDLAIYQTYRTLLTARCEGKLQFCGFKELTPGELTKKVKMPDGTKVKVVLEIQHPSISTVHSENVGPLKDQQLQKTAEMNEWFFGGLKDADLAIYHGHARNGGGPDFSPPVLLKSLHVNYPFYQKTKPGLTRLIEGLKAAQHPAAMVIMACNSGPLFGKAIDAVAPEMGLISTNFVPKTGDGIFKASIASVDSFLRFQCKDGFDREVYSDAGQSAFIKTDLMK